jgi:hypothetical protein
MCCATNKTNPYKKEQAMNVVYTTATHGLLTRKEDLYHGVLNELNTF